MGVCCFRIVALLVLWCRVVCYACGVHLRRCFCVLFTVCERPLLYLCCGVVARCSGYIVLLVLLRVLAGVSALWRYWCCVSHVVPYVAVSICACGVSYCWKVIAVIAHCCGLLCVFVVVLLRFCCGGLPYFIMLLSVCYIAGACVVNMVVLLLLCGIVVLL